MTKLENLKKILEKWKNVTEKQVAKLENKKKINGEVGGKIGIFEKYGGEIGKIEKCYGITGGKI